MYHECDGCFEKDACPIQDASGASDCPCVECLVKAMCGEGCVEWDKMYEEFKNKK